jgi:hypothetical protein
VPLSFLMWSRGSKPEAHGGHQGDGMAVVRAPPALQPTTTTSSPGQHARRLTPAAASSTWTSASSQPPPGQSIDPAGTTAAWLRLGRRTATLPCAPAAPPTPVGSVQRRGEGWSAWRQPPAGVMAPQEVRGWLRSWHLQLAGSSQPRLCPQSGCGADGCIREKLSPKDFTGPQSMPPLQAR